MKIAILTQPLHTNYGGLLQNYALQQALKRMGHEAETLTLMQTPAKPSLYMECRSFAASLYHSLRGEQKWNSVYWPYNTKKRNRNAIISRFSKDFTDRHIVRSASLDTEAQLRAYCEARGFDAYIVGSDQTWRPRYNSATLEWMYLSFLGDDGQPRRIAYASSFGTDKWEATAKQTAMCSRLAKRFHAISVREASGVELCKQYLDVEATQVIDPTMLLTAADYQRLAQSALTEEQGESRAMKPVVFAYILDKNPQKEEFISEAARQLEASAKIQTCTTPMTAYMKLEKALRQTPPPVAQWLRNIAGAELVITDSFHGTVFSILHHKPFLVMENPHRGTTRMVSLLGMFGLEGRLVSEDSLEAAALSLPTLPPIDWERVEATLAGKREEAFSFLTKALRKNEQHIQNQS